MAEGPVQQSSAKDLNYGAIYRQSNNSETLSGDKTVARDAEQDLLLDPDGAARNVDLPEDEEGLEFTIVNTASSANDLTVRDSETNTVHAVSQNEAATFRNYGGGWYVVAGATASGGQDV